MRRPNLSRVVNQDRVCDMVTRRVARVWFGFAMTAAVAGAAVGQDASETQPESQPKAAWEAFADCAAGYEANVKSRQSDPSRTPEMRDMIQEQADDYRRASLRAYLNARGESEEVATRAVDAHIAGAIDRYVAMDKAGELDSFLDKCPQPEATSDD